MDGERKTLADIYGRQSMSKDRSIDQQIGLGRDRVNSEGWTVHAIYSDGVSASRRSKKSRDDWPELVADVQAGRVDVVWLWESSRGDRRASSWLTFLEHCQDHHVKIYVETDRRLYDMDSRREWRTLADDGIDSQDESEKTRLRVLRDTEDRARQGRPHGMLAYGYQRNYDVRPNGQRVYLGTVPHPEEARIVREIYRRIADGEWVYVIARDLTKRRVPTSRAPSPGRRAAVWRGPTVTSIATNRTYLGQRVWRGEVVETQRQPWPPVVDQALWDKVQGRIADRDRPRRPDTTAKHLLSGIALCGVCGGKMYRRGNYQCNDRGCTARDPDRLEDYVVPRAVAVMARRQDLLSDDDSDPELAEAIAERDGLRRRWEALADDLDVDEVTLARRARAIRSRLDELDTRIRKLRLPVALGRVDGPVAEVWDSLDLATKRVLIREAVDVTVHRIGQGQPWRDDAVIVEPR